MASASSKSWRAGASAGPARDPARDARATWPAAGHAARPDCGARAHRARTVRARDDHVVRAHRRRALARALGDRRELAAAQRRAHGARAYADVRRHVADDRPHLPRRGRTIRARRDLAARHARAFVRPAPRVHAPPDARGRHRALHTHRSRAPRVPRRRRRRFSFPRSSSASCGAPSRSGSRSICRSSRSISPSRRSSWASGCSCSVRRSSRCPASCCSS